MMIAATLFFWFGFIGLAMVWLVYPAVLWLLSRKPVRRTSLNGSGPRTATVLVAAHNEAANIASRLDNIFGQETGDMELQTLIALDHCTDSTLEIIRQWSAAHPDLRVDWFETGQRGKAMAHNEAMTRISSDLVIFTDADTIFKPGFVENISACFVDPRVGYASGVLSWRGKTTPEGVSNFPLYWRFETWLRIMESNLDICAVGTGACSAMRPELFVPLHPTSDSDCSTPIDVVRQSWLCRIVPDAQAVDFVADTVSGEFRARVRMTAKNFLNTIASWNWREAAFKEPSVTASLILHKIGRWLTPYFAASLLLGGAALTIANLSGFATAVTFIAMAGLASGCAGLLVPELPVFGALGSFLMANTAFAVGVFKALTGNVPTSFART